MRVIGGQYRSRKLIAPAGPTTRPSSDRLRETLFNVVSARVVESVWLDLFAGSGAVGIAARSRGTLMGYSADTGARAAKAIRANINTLAITEGFEIQQREVARASRAL